ncbi:hypothetical protein K438DRAFT_2134418 [Mycena galopus ATCC 62051]|nr:hypothetical protein K438DRAFT_2134418 [Mycena galopus ATCC 62051]
MYDGGIINVVRKCCEFRILMVIGLRPTYMYHLTLSLSDVPGVQDQAQDPHYDYRQQDQTSFSFGGGYEQQSNTNTYSFPRHAPSPPQLPSVHRGLPKYGAHSSTPYTGNPYLFSDQPYNPPFPTHSSAPPPRLPSIHREPPQYGAHSSTPYTENPYPFSDQPYSPPLPTHSNAPQRFIPNQDLWHGTPTRPAQAFGPTSQQINYQQLYGSSQLASAPPPHPPQFGSAWNTSQTTTIHDVLLVEVQERFDEIILSMDIANKACTNDARVMWGRLWTSMQTSSYGSEDWVADIGTRLLELVAELVIDALGSLCKWNRLQCRADICKPRRQYSQQGNKSALLYYNNELISALGTEWKTDPVLKAHEADFTTDVLRGGPLVHGAGIIKKIGLQQCTISEDLCRYGVIFTGTTMMITSQDFNKQILRGVRVSPFISLDESNQVISASAVSLLFAVMFPHCLLNFPHMPDPRSSLEVWSMLAEKLRSSVGSGQSSEAPDPSHRRSGGGADGYGGGPGDSNFGGHGGFNFGSRGGFNFESSGSESGGGGSNYGRYNCQSMTLLHTGVPGVFNPPRKLVVIAPEDLQSIPAESQASIGDDSASDISGTSTTTATTSTSADSCLLPLEGTSISTAPSTPPSGDMCLLPDAHIHFEELPHLEISHVVHWGDITRVLSASLTVADNIPFPVILKILKQAQFHLAVQEVMAYHQLARACVIVPRLISLMAPAHESGWVVIVIEDAGKPFGRGRQAWDEISLTPAERTGIYFALVQIHGEGVLHGELEPRNVQVKEVVSDRAQLNHVGVRLSPPSTARCGPGPVVNPPAVLTTHVLSVIVTAFSSMRQPWANPWSYLNARVSDSARSNLKASSFLSSQKLFYSSGGLHYSLSSLENNWILNARRDFGYEPIANSIQDLKPSIFKYSISSSR